MTAIPNEFRALYVEKDGEDVSVAFRTLRPEDLPPGEVTIRVAYSSVNYKDGLAVIPTGRVVRRYPMVPGIDLAGTVVESQDPRFQPGDEVLAYQLRDRRLTLRRLQRVRAHSRPVGPPAAGGPDD